MGYKEHKSHSVANLTFDVLIASDSRTKKTDKSGPIIARLLTDAGHKIITRDILPDEPEMILSWLAKSTAQIAIISGGTGISLRDMTIEAISSIKGKNLPGFGELFRQLSYNEIGSGAMMSRTLCRITEQGKIIFCIPGSTGAVRLALTQLIIPETGHLIYELNK